MLNFLVIAGIVAIIALIYTPIHGIRQHGFVGFMKEIFVIKPGTFKIAKPVIREDAMY